MDMTSGDRVCRCMAVSSMSSTIEKPIGVIYCTADLRKDRCPAKIRDNDHPTVTSACLRCEYARVKHFKRGKVVVEAGEKDVDEKKAYISEV